IASKRTAAIAAGSAKQTASTRFAAKVEQISWSVTLGVQAKATWRLFVGLLLNRLLFDHLLLERNLLDHLRLRRGRGRGGRGRGRRWRWRQDVNDCDLRYLARYAPVGLQEKEYSGRQQRYHREAAAQYRDKPTNTGLALAVSVFAGSVHYTVVPNHFTSG